MQQLITPNPNIPCKPGWCLQYVRQAYGLPAAYPTATAAWLASTSKHTDRNFPKVWTPIWFSLVNEPAGHVALMAPDGSVYSTSDLSNKPHHHLDISDLMNYYARYGMTLKYLGWTEDVAGYAVMEDGGLAAMGTTTTVQEDEDMPITDDDAKKIARFLLDEVVTTEDNKPATLRWFLASEKKGRGEVITAIVDGIFGRKIKVEGEGETGETSFAAEIGWFRNNFRRAQK